jgi:hypothetical protein
MAVDGLGGDVKLLAPVHAMPVPDQSHLLEDGQGPIHRGWDRCRVDRPAALDQLRAGHVAARRRQSLDDGAALRRPAHPALAHSVADRPPRLWKCCVLVHSATQYTEPTPYCNALQ